MKIVVLAGGISTEREVSLSTGDMIYQALKKRGHQVVLLDCFLGCPDQDPATIFDRERDRGAEPKTVGAEVPNLEEVKALRPDWGKKFFGPGVLAICQQADVVFMALHGGDGENGRIQACFDLLGITYTGTDYVSSAMCMDKNITKEMFRANGIPTPSGFLLRKGESHPMPDFPCIVKASRGGSSVGVSLAETPEGYEKALEEAFRYDEDVVVETYIRGREFSVAVLDGKALPVIEIAPVEGFYDYKNKYQAGSAVETCPAQLPKEKFQEMQQWSEKIFEVMRLRSYARMDFMMEGATGNLYCLEVNTLPGMTPTSLLPQEAKAIGWSFEELCEKIIAISKKDRREA